MSLWPIILTDIISLCILLSMILGIRWRRYRRRWYYRCERADVGTFSDHQLSQLYKNAQIEPETPIRQVRDSDWHLGVAVESPPRRFWRSVRLAILSGVTGLFLCYFMFGSVQGLDGQGRYIDLGHVFSPPNKYDVKRLSGLTEKEQRNLGIVWTVTAVVPYTGRLADRIAIQVDQFVARMENSRSRIQIGTVFCILLGAFGGAFTARAQARIFKTSRVQKVKRKSSPDSGS